MTVDPAGMRPFEDAMLVSSVPLLLITTITSAQNFPVRV